MCASAHKGVCIDHLPTRDRHTRKKQKTKTHPGKEKKSTSEGRLLLGGSPLEKGKEGWGKWQRYKTCIALFDLCCHLSAVPCQHRVPLEFPAHFYSVLNPFLLQPRPPSSTHLQVALQNFQSRHHYGDRLITFPGQSSIS